MSLELVWTILYGAICGYVASRILGGEGFGFLGNIVVGILGGIIGAWMVQKLQIPALQNSVGRFVSAVGGAIILIVVLEILRNSYSTSTRKR